MIEIVNVSKSFNGFSALSDVSLTVEKGQIFGLIGENGAGKTTLIQCLTGIYKPDSGEIKVDSLPVYDNPKAKCKIGYVADGNQFFPYETIKGLIRFYKGIYSTFSDEKFDRLNAEFHLDKNRRILQLSKGMQMRLAFMMALSIQPEVLVLDEPTSGLDAIAKNALLNLLVEEVEQNKTTVLISTHHLNELEKLSDRMAIIQNGQIAYETDMDDLKSSIKKFQVVFANPPQNPDAPFIDCRILHTEKVGGIYYFIVDDTEGTFHETLFSQRTLVNEEVGLSLEEIFIHTASDALNRGRHHA